MTEHIIIAGAGGQGIMLLGKVLAMAAMKEERYVTWLPSYGAEVRGGTAHCMIVISDREIGSPYIDKADTLIIMNEPSMGRFKSRVKDNGLLIINSSLVRKKLFTNDSRLLAYPFTEIALELGNLKVANTVALGSFIAKKKIVDLKTVIQVIKDMAPENREDLIEINTKALAAGFNLTEE